MQDSSLPQFWETRYRDHVMPWDAGAVPLDLRAFAATLPANAHILVPGCGSAHEVRYLADTGADVVAIDFSAAAVELGKKHAGPFAQRIRLADFFQFDPDPNPIDVVYERAFLCALPKKLWPRYAERMGDLLHPGGQLAGFFFYGTNPRGPPFGTSPGELHGLLDCAFDLVEDRAAGESLAMFAGGERWQVWRRR
ncbi:MAG TPA: methyltransferase domain-containing protein [Burkholderiales bacterium]|nr:methyltransferase domain-containing protein [Burkholderiales bacterium]